MIELLKYIARRFLCGLRGHNPYAREAEDGEWIIRCGRCGMTGEEMWPPTKSRRLGS